MISLPALRVFTSEQVMEEVMNHRTVESLILAVALGLAAFTLYGAAFDLERLNKANASASAERK